MCLCIVYTYISPRQKYFKYKLQLRFTYHMILDQNESTKIFFGRNCQAQLIDLPSQACYQTGSKAGWADLFRFIKPVNLAQNIFWWIHFGLASRGR